MIHSRSLPAKDAYNLFQLSHHPLSGQTRKKLIMANEHIKFRLWKRILRYAPLIVLFSIVVIILWQIQKPAPAYQHKQYFVYTSPFFSMKECSPDEKRIAKHFAADTLPGLMQKGLIHRYQRNASGTAIAVNGKLWRKRSKFFKTSLLTEVLVFNKVQGYKLSTKIIDSLSGKLYAYISPSTKMDFYD